MFSVLLRRELKANFFNRSIKRNFFDIFLTIFTYCIIMAVIVFLLVKLTEGMIYYHLESEFLVLTIYLGMIIQTIFGFGLVSRYLYEDLDYLVLLPLPIKSSTIVSVKVIILYLKQLFLALAFYIPLGIAYGISSNHGVQYYLLFLLVVFFVPTIPLIINVIFGRLYLRINSFLSRNIIVKFIILIILFGGLFFGLREVINLLIKLMNENRLQNIFNIRTANFLNVLTKYLFPANLHKEILSGERVLLNIGILLFISVLFILFSVWVVSKRYLAHIRVENKYSSSLIKKDYRNSGIATVFLKKEMLRIARSGDLFVSHLLTLAILPFMSYIMVTIISDVVTRMIGYSYVFPFVLMILLMLSGVSNTYCSMMISNEKKFLPYLSTFPVSIKKQVNIKVLLNIFLLTISLVVTVLILVITRKFTALDGLFAFVILFLVNLNFIFRAVLNDLRNPALEGDFRENRNTSIFITRNLLLSFIIGGLSLLFVGLYPLKQANLMLIAVVAVFLVLRYYHYQNQLQKRGVNYEG